MFASFIKFAKYLLTESFALIQWQFVTLVFNFFKDKKMCCQRRPYLQVSLNLRNICLLNFLLWYNDSLPLLGTLVFNLLSFRIVFIYITSHNPKERKIDCHRHPYLPVEYKPGKKNLIEFANILLTESFALIQWQFATCVCTCCSCDLKEAFWFSRVAYLFLKASSSSLIRCILFSRQSMYSFFFRRLSWAEI